MIYEYERFQERAAVQRTPERSGSSASFYWWMIYLVVYLLLKILKDLHPTSTKSVMIRVLLAARLKIKAPISSLRIILLRPYMAYIRTWSMTFERSYEEIASKAPVDILSVKQNVNIVPNAWYCSQNRPNACQLMRQTIFRTTYTFVIYATKFTGELQYLQLKRRSWIRG